MSYELEEEQDYNEEMENIRMKQDQEWNLFNEQKSKTLYIERWDTINYPEGKLGSAEIRTTHYSKGVYLMEGVKGYDFFETSLNSPSIGFCLLLQDFQCNLAA